MTLNDEQQYSKLTKMNQTLLTASERLKAVNLTKSSTKSHTQLKEDKLCTRFSSAPVLMKYTSYWIHSVNTNRDQVL